jgi:hypothetical protein
METRPVGFVSRWMPWVLLGWAVSAVLLFHVAVYPLNRWRVPIGSDTPAYVWWARYAGVTGLNAPEVAARPLIIGAIATLSEVTKMRTARLISALLVMFALFSPAIAAIAASGLLRANVDRFLRRGSGVLRNEATPSILLSIFGIVALAVHYWIPWWGQNAQISAEAWLQARAASTLLASQPPALR